ncbi:hypothetical protein [Streptomyces sp. NBC_00134]|uniref:hypothetical protein n=1 Tax=Streptomyces sp. NBC_00134 TaxID=2975663 RepID=UPI003249604E
MPARTRTTASKPPRPTGACSVTRTVAPRERSEIRDQWEQQARKAAGDRACDTYDTAYHRSLTDDAEHGLAHALQGRAGP